MLIPNHPADERLSALASGDPDAAADAALSEHVASCIRCTDTVAELGALRASLAELPDLQPHRPLRLVPPVDEPARSRADAVGGWARRFFAPMLTAGAALALVGVVGTTAPLLGGAQSGAAPNALGGAETDTATHRDGANPAAGAGASEVPGALDNGSEAAPSAEATDEAFLNAPDAGEGAASASNEPAAMHPLQSEEGTEPQADSGGDAGRLTLTDDRPIRPMLIFAGVALMIAAALLRWILAPRAA
jgi:anti-sigma factor RsiW